MRHKRSSDKIRRQVKYEIYKMKDGRYAVISHEPEFHIVTIARTYDKAGRHILHSTGKWPRCAHDWKPAKKVWQIGEEDSYKCEICGQYKKNRRFLNRSIKGHSKYKSPRGIARPSNIRKHNEPQIY